KPESHRRGDPRRHGRRALPLHDLLPRPGRDQARGARRREGRRRRKRRRNRHGRARMSAPLNLPKAIELALRAANPSTSRRGFLAGSGALVLSLAIEAVPGGRALAQAVNAGPYPDRDFLKLDTWIVIHPDNTATFYVGKTDGGQGTGTAFRQMMS